MTSAPETPTVAVSPVVWPRLSLFLLALAAATMGQLGLYWALGENVGDYEYAKHPQWFGLAGAGYGVAALFMVAACAFRRSVPAPGPRVPLWLEISLVLLLFFGGLAVRLYRVAELPDVLFVDELNLFLDATKVLSGEIRSPFQVGWFDHFTFFAFIQAGVIRLVDACSSWLGEAGISIWTAKATAASFGALTIPLVHVLLRYWFGSGLALTGTALLAFSRWHITASRYGEGDKMLLVLIATGLLYAVSRALDLCGALRGTVPNPTEGKPWYGLHNLWFLLAGLLLGIAQYFWITGRILPVIVLALWIWVVLRHSQFWISRLLLIAGTLLMVSTAVLAWQRVPAPLVLLLAALSVVTLVAGSFPNPATGRNFPGVVLMFVAFAVLVLPLVQELRTNPGALTIRLEQLSIGSEIAREHSWAPLWRNVRNYLLMYNYRTGGWPCANVPNEPALFFPEAVLFALGVAIALLRCTNPAYMLLVLWPAGLLLGGILSLTEQSPVPHRVLETIPWCAMMVTLYLAEVWSLLWQLPQPRTARVLRAVFWVVVVAVVGVTGARNVHDYFSRVVYLPVFSVKFNTEWTFGARRCAELAKHYDVYVPLDWYWSAIVRVATWPGTHLHAYQGVRSFPLTVSAGRGVALVFPPHNIDFAELLPRCYPTFTHQVHEHPRTGAPLFHVFRVEAKDVNALRGLIARPLAPHVSQVVDCTVATVHIPVEKCAHVSDATAPWTFQGWLSVQEPGLHTFQLVSDSSAAGTLRCGARLLFLEPGQPVHCFLPLAGVPLVAELPWANSAALHWQQPGHATLAPIAPEVLWHTGPPTEWGLLVRYYTNSTFSGPPVYAQVEPGIGTGGNVPAPCAVQWSGEMLIESAGQHTFRIEADDGARLWLRNEVVFDGLNSGGMVEGTISVDLPEGWVPLTLDYNNQGGAATLVVRWAPPGQSFRPIPVTRLRPGNAEGTSADHLDRQRGE